MFNVTPETFWFKIVCKESSQSHPDDIIYLSWRNMTFEHRMRWDWYFLYRAALMQVQHPRWTVNVFWGSEIISTADDLLKWKKNKITAKKGRSLN